MSWAKGKPMPTQAARPTPISKRITEMRMELNMTQRDLAEKVGINRVTILKYERGEYVPYLSNIGSLAMALQTTPNYILTGEGNRWRQTEYLPWKTYRDPRGKIYCPYCGHGSGWSIRELEKYGLQKPNFCDRCGRRVLNGD